MMEVSWHPFRVRPETNHGTQGFARGASATHGTLAHGLGIRNLARAIETVFL